MQTQTALEPVPTRTVVIADRSGHFREALRRVLDSSANVSIVGEANSLRDALRLVRSAEAGVVLLDVDLVMNQPAERLRRIVRAFPSLEVVVLLNDDLPGYRRAIAERWGYKCVAKENAESELPRALGLVRKRTRTRRR